MTPTFFESLKQYVGFTEASSAALHNFHAVAQPHFRRIIDDFYDAIESHPGARAAITGGSEQIERLKHSLIQWLHSMLLGPHDEAYFEMRARIGRVHVRISLPQSYMFTAMNRIRVRLLEVLRNELPAHPDLADHIGGALHQILDLELAIMLETYREDMLAKSRSAERLAAIGQFAASIGHELRNPLGVIESSLFLLREHLGQEVADKPQVAKHLDRIGDEVKRSNKTIHDLLELAHDRPPRRQRAPLRTIVDRSRATADLPSGVDFYVAIADDLMAEVDPDQLQQVLVNLFINAHQAMGSAGRIDVEAARLADGGLSLRVKDDGPGIAPEVRYRIFEALFTTKAKGSGLGLALCRRILEAHGGTIEIESSTRGASFLMRFPRLPTLEATPP